MLHVVELDKKDNALVITGPFQYYVELFKSFKYDIEHKQSLELTISDGKFYIASEEYDLDDLAESIVLDDLTLEYGDVKELLPLKYPVVADWEG